MKNKLIKPTIFVFTFLGIPALLYEACVCLDKWGNYIDHGEARDWAQRIARVICLGFTSVVYLAICIGALFVSSQILMAVYDRLCEYITPTPVRVYTPEPDCFTKEAEEEVNDLFKVEK